MHTSLFITCSTVTIEMVQTQMAMEIVIYGLLDALDANIVSLYRPDPFSHRALLIRDDKRPSESVWSSS